MGTKEVIRRTGKAEATAGRWQERFAEEDYEGLMRDRARTSRLPPLRPEPAERVVALTLHDPPAGATHWTGAMMAEALGIRVSSVQRIWRAQGLRPHRFRQSKLSKDPELVAKLRDVVGLKFHPPAQECSMKCVGERCAARSPRSPT